MFKDGDSVRANVEYIRRHSRYFNEKELSILENSVGTIACICDSMYKVVFTNSGIERIDNFYSVNELLHDDNIIEF